jgi:glycine/D-amino acid oxidase-like deaminating enzyme
MTSTVILGSGIIGLSTAYYLADHQPANTIHLVDASPTLFASASGYAGGFLADGTWKSAATASLGNLSFAEHRRLADKHNGAGRWGYARTVPVSYDVDGKEGDGDALKRREDETKMGAVPSWLKRVDGDKLSIIGNGQGVAILWVIHSREQALSFYFSLMVNTDGFPGILSSFVSF